MLWYFITAKRISSSKCVQLNPIHAFRKTNTNLPIHTFHKLCRIYSIFAETVFYYIDIHNNCIKWLASGSREKKRQSRSWSGYIVDWNMKMTSCVMIASIFWIMQNLGLTRALFRRRKLHVQIASSTAIRNPRGPRWGMPWGSLGHGCCQDIHTWP